MKRILKYQLAATLQLPADGKILALQVQHEVPMLWLLADDTAPVVTRRFEVYTTGAQISEDIESRLEYVGTYQVDWFVGHVFERR